MINSKKTIHLAIAIFASLVVNAQKNVFLERSYWKSKPELATVQADIAKGNDPAQSDSNGFDPTVLAINESAPDETIKFLLDQKGNDINKITHDGRTYIFWAAYKGNVELMNYILAKGAKTDVLDDHGYTFTNFAAANGKKNIKVYDLGIKAGANLKKDLDHDGANALLLAAPYDKDFTLINYFTSKGLDIKSTDANGNTAFDYAAKNGDVEFLKAMVKKGVKYTDNAMIMASQGTRGKTNILEVYQYLETLKIKPTVIGKNGQTVLHNIVRKEKQNDIISYFIGKGIDVNKADNDGNTAFMNAAASNPDVTVLELLSSKVKNINQVNKKGLSALTLAVKGNSPEVVNFLISKGADVNVTDATGDNLAAYLVQSYNPKKTETFDAKIKALEAKGFNFTIPQKNGNTLYHLAVAKNDLTLLQRLKDSKVDINAKNNEGFTALHKAAMTAQDDSIIKYLLDAGAKKEPVTEFNETAFDLASENESLTKNHISIDFLK